MTDNVLPFRADRCRAPEQPPEGWIVSDWLVEEDEDKGAWVELRRKCDGFSVVGTARTYANAVKLARIEAKRVNEDVPPQPGRFFGTDRALFEQWITEMAGDFAPGITAEDRAALDDYNQHNS